MKLFELHRDADETGVSGTGIVAQGVIFDSGFCSLSWLTEHTSVAIYKSIEDVIAIHGHDGKTRVMQVMNCDDDAVRGVLSNCYQDNCENVHVGLPLDDYSTPPDNETEAHSKLAAYLWDERQKLYRLFTPIEIATGLVKT